MIGDHDLCNTSYWHVLLLVSTCPMFILPEMLKDSRTAWPEEPTFTREYMQTMKPTFLSGLSGPPLSDGAGKA